MNATRKKSPHHNWRPFEEAREFARGLDLRGTIEWRKWSQTNARPSYIPSQPDRVYESEGWVDWADWLGTRYRRGKWRPFEEARAFVRSLGLKNQVEWNQWRKTAARPNDIPTTPNHAYKDKGWISWGDWFGTGYIANQERVYRPFEEAREFVRSLGLKNKNEWNIWIHSNDRPDDLPVDPFGVYWGKGWISWSDWLNNRNRKGGYRSFQEARAFVRSFGLPNRSAWREWAASDERPEDIPANPEEVYRGKGWAGFGDWLGTGNVAPQDRVYRPFQEARAFVRSLGLRSKDDWAMWTKSNARPEDIPSLPSRTYQGIGWGGVG